MEIKLSKAGKIRYERPDLREWIVSIPEHPDVMQMTVYAGEQMIAYGTEDNDEMNVYAPFTLTYCGFKAGPFATMDDAKANAPEFAREVLRRMIDMI
jgi:hypothetical protein